MTNRSSARLREETPHISDALQAVFHHFDLALFSKKFEGIEMP